MWERVEPRLRELARRAGMGDVEPRIFAAVCVLCAIVCAWALWRWWPREMVPPHAGTETLLAVEAAGGGSPTGEAGAGVVSGVASDPAQPSRLLVHVVGAVRRPGVYELAAGTRVVDAVEAAGGMLPDAVARGVNLAREITDGEQVLIPDEDDPVLALPPSGLAVGGGAAPGGSVGGEGTVPVNVNTADAALLETLPGVGPATAAKIIAEREANGPFLSVDDLRRVSGIGPKKLEQLRGVACVK